MPFYSGCEIAILLSMTLKKNKAYCKHILIILSSMTHDLRIPLNAIFGFILLTGDGSIAHIFYR